MLPDETPATAQLAPSTLTYAPGAELAAMLRCHVRTLDRLAARGVIPPPIRIGTRRRWDVRRVLAALEAAK